MRKRNPIAYLVLGAGALLAVLLVIASSRRAVDDPVPTVGDGTVASLLGAATTARSGSAATTAATTASTTAARAASTVPKAGTTAATAPKGMASVSATALPREARATLALIEAGGPFPYDRDGVVFQNRERLLPRRADGYYHEYTVDSPGSDDRGPRRIIAGLGGERYYTDDHYDSFRLVVP